MKETQESNRETKKVICYVRASTNKQEVESQRQAVYEMAYKDGFNDNQIVPVGKEGISACEDLKGGYDGLFNEMEDHIAYGNIACVYVFCMTRLVRMDESRFTHFINHTLVPNKVQLRIKEGGYTLLNEDGTVNNGMEIAIKTIALLNKQATQELKANLKRGKDFRKAKGLFAGGHPTYGFVMPDKHKAVIIDPETAPTVERIFKMYLEEQKSTYQIGRQLYQEGLFKDCRSLASTICKVNKILKCTDYIGNDIYPVLISSVTFEKVQERLAQQYIKPRDSYKNNVYICKGLLYFNNRALKARKDVGTYVYNVVGRESCYLNIDIADTLLIQLADHFLHAPLISDNTAIVEQYNAKVAEYKRMIATKEQRIEELMESRDDLGEREYLRKISEKRAEGLRVKLDNEIKENEKAIVELEGNIKDLLNTIAAMKEQKMVDVYSMPRKEQAEIVKKCIDRVDLEKIKRGQLKLQVHYKPNIAGTQEDETYIVYAHKHVVTQLYDGMEHPIILEGYGMKHIKKANLNGLMTIEQMKQAYKEKKEKIA